MSSAPIIEPIAPDHPAHRHLVARLAQRMSDVSEDTWFAGWLIDLEFLLWDALQGGPNHEFRNEDIQELKELSTLVGGWHDQYRFIPLDEWLAIVHLRTLELRARDSR